MEKKTTFDIRTNPKIDLKGQVEWVRVDDVKKMKDILTKLIDNQKVRGLYMNEYTLIEYSQVRVNIDCAFELILENFENKGV